MRRLNASETLAHDINQLASGRQLDYGKIFQSGVRMGAVLRAMMVAAPETDVLYRVKFLSGGTVEVVCIDMPVDYTSESVGRDYADQAELPQWLQDRILSLRMLTEGPPSCWVEGVGRRINEDVFWVVK